jgi:hypothetical protein
MFPVFAVASAVSTAAVRGGSWNESGLVEGLNRKGFTTSKCGSELIANSCDAQSSKIWFKANTKFIKMIDIGKGMNMIGYNSMFDMYKANNALNKAMGVSGMGGKAALNQLSKKQDNGEPTPVLVFTRTKNGEFLKAIVPWDDIFNTKVYTGKIIFDHMTEDEIAEFLKDRENESFQNGTTIQWEYSDRLMELFDMQFIKENREKEIKIEDRWDLIFGVAGVDIILEKSDGTQPVILPKYNYFGDNHNHYYTGKDIQTIDHYVDDNNNNRYIWHDENGNSKESKPLAKGFSKDLRDVTIHQKWKLIGDYTIYNGLRKNIKLFDEKLPCEFRSSECFLCDYDSAFFNLTNQKDKIRDYLSKTRLYRNDQCITEYKLEGFNSATARGSGNEMLKTFHHRTEIHYTTYSTQDNRMDIAMGIQENKNQNLSELPKNLERVVCILKKRNIDKINNYFADVIKSFVKPLPSESDSETSELDNDSETSELDNNSENSESDNDSESDSGSDDGSVSPVPPPIPDPEIAYEKANILKLLDRVADTVKNLESLNIIKESKTNIQALLEKLLANE